MAIGLLGRKLGMTRSFDASGVSIPITVVYVETNRVSQIKTLENDGYDAVQVGTISCKQSRLIKPQLGHIAKAFGGAVSHLAEFRLSQSDINSINLGKEFNVDHFSIGQRVDVTAITKGKGYAGTVKRHNFRTQDMTHGNSVSHRAPGSIGQNQTPGKVFKGKKMAGRLGNEQCTLQNLQIHDIDTTRNLIMIKGGIPGSKGTVVTIKPSCKFKQEKS